MALIYAPFKAEKANGLGVMTFFEDECPNLARRKE